MRHITIIMAIREINVDTFVSGRHQRDRLSH